MVMKLVLIVAALVVIAALMVPVVVTQIENSQSDKNDLLLQTTPKSSAEQHQTAVVVYSRSGNTAVLGRHIADLNQGDFFRLESPEYKLGIKGWINSLRDARKGEAIIASEPIDLSSYDTVYLGSPIWLYSPSPPIWQFVETHDLTGKDVVLFNTFNSQFKQKFIDDFQTLVLNNGARSFTHKYVRRGRMGQQISTDLMLETYDQL